MRYWLGAVVVGCALVGLAALPPVAARAPRQSVPSQAEARAAALTQDVQRTASILQHRHIAELVVPRTLAASGPLAFEAPEGLDPTVVSNHRDRALKEIQARHLEDSQVALGLFLLPSRTGAYHGRGGMLSDTEYFWGERNGRAYCITVRPVMTRANGGQVVSAIPPYRDVLGVCAVVARYGLPGPAVEAWLQDGGAAMATSLDPGPGLQDFWGMYSAMGVDLASLTRGAGALRTGNLSVTRCLASVPAGCAQMLLEPGRTIWYGSTSGVRRDVVARSPVSALGATTLFEPTDAHVIGDLAARFGEDRVRAFWHADGDFLNAFQTSFGEDAGRWNLDRLRPVMGIRTAGPEPSKAGLLGGLLVVTLCGAVAAAWAGRRRVA